MSITVQAAPTTDGLARARALEQAGRRDAAAIAYHQALRAAAATPEALPRIHWQMAKCRLQVGNVAGALDAIRQALLYARLMPAAVADGDRHEMQIDLGEIHQRLGLADDARRAFERASQASSEATLSRLAATAFRYNLWQPAVEVLRRCVALHPASLTARWNLAHALSESWQLDAALQALDDAEALGVLPGAPGLRASIALRRGDADTALATYVGLAKAEPGNLGWRGSVAMTSLYSDRISAAEVTGLHRRLFAAAGRGARAADSFANPRSTDRKLRVGFVTADLHHQHPVNIFMQPLLARLDRSAFDLAIYYTGETWDDQTARARAAAGHWVQATAINDAQLARQIEADRIDVLVDLSGLSAKNRVALFARRAAPVQATFIGYPGTTGVPNIDWIIADPVVAPEGSETLYSERIARLPGTVFTYAPGEAYPQPAFGPEQATRPLTFGSFNNLPKLTPRTVALWSQVLLAVPGSRLLLKAPSFTDEATARLVAGRFAAHGVVPEQLEFRGPSGLNDMMAEYADVDIALDTVPFNGGTTSLQAMWMGAPVLCVEGERFASRMSASFMRAAGLDDWVATDDAQFVEIARRQAANRDALLALRRGLRARLMARPAWDADANARAFGGLLRQMWADWCVQAEAN